MVEIAHPLDREGVVEHIILVEAEKHGDLRLVQDAQRVKHVRSESVRVLTSDCICDIQIYSGEGARKRLGDDLSTGRLRKGLNLTWSIKDHIAISCCQ